MADPIFLLDTNILSNAGLQRPPPGLRWWMKAIGAKSLAISFPVIAELRRGAHLASQHDPQKAKRLHDWIEDILSVDFQFAEFSPEAAGLYAEMTTVGPLRHLYVPDPKQKKDKLGHDLFFAALSIVHKMPIASFNVKDFILIDRYFPLPGVFHPVEDKWHVRYYGDLPATLYRLPPPSLPEFVSSGFSFMK
jgi:predicted nucleic acid-binding protein